MSFLSQNSFEILLSVLTPPGAGGPYVSGLTLLAYDYLCTLPEEVAYVWSSSFTPGVALFYANRYLPFVEIILMGHVQLAKGPAKVCKRQSDAGIWLMFIGATVGQSIIVMRTWAFWSWNFWVCGMLGVFLLASIVVSGVFAWQQNLGMTYIDLFIPIFNPPLKAGCIVSVYDGAVKYAFIAVLCLELMIVILTSIRAYQIRSRSAWTKKLYRRAIFYSACMLCMTFANIVANTKALNPPVLLTLWFTPFQRVIHSVTCNRVLFQIFEGRTKRRLQNATTSFDVNLDSLAHRAHHHHHLPGQRSDRHRQSYSYREPEMRSGTGTNIFSTIFLEDQDDGFDRDVGPGIDLYNGTTSGGTKTYESTGSVTVYSHSRSHSPGRERVPARRERRISGPELTAVYKNKIHKRVEEDVVRAQSYRMRSLSAGQQGTDTKQDGKRDGDGQVPRVVEDLDQRRSGEGKGGPVVE